MNPWFWIVVAAVLLLALRGGGRRAMSYHRSLTSRIRSHLLFAGLLVAGMWFLNTRYGGS